MTIDYCLPSVQINTTTASSPSTFLSNFLKAAIGAAPHGPALTPHRSSSVIAARASASVMVVACSGRIACDNVGQA